MIAWGQEADTPTPKDCSRQNYANRCVVQELATFIASRISTGGNNAEFDGIKTSKGLSLEVRMSMLY
jgi:hypothetical protein